MDFVSWNGLVNMSRSSEAMVGVEDDWLDRGLDGELEEAGVSGRRELLWLWNKDNRWRIGHS